MPDVLSIAIAIAAAAGSIVAAIATALTIPTSGGTWDTRTARALLASVATFAITASSLYVLDYFQVGPFKERGIAITSGVGPTSCTTDLTGTATVPPNEEAWILLITSKGDVYVKGVGGPRPIVESGQSKEWRIPSLTVSRQYYKDANYDIIGIVVPLADSLRLRQALAQRADADQPLRADQYPSSVLAQDHKTITTVTGKDCA